MILGGAQSPTSYLHYQEDLQTSENDYDCDTDTDTDGCRYSAAAATVRLSVVEGNGEGSAVSQY